MVNVLSLLVKLTPSRVKEASFPAVTLPLVTLVKFPTASIFSTAPAPKRLPPTFSMFRVSPAPFCFAVKVNFPVTKLYCIVAAAELLLLTVVITSLRVLVSLLNENVWSLILNTTLPEPSKVNPNTD